MEVKEIIKERLKDLFPKANLSVRRLDDISDKLSKKITDVSQVDDILNSANELISFEDIAKEDDRIRTLEAKVKQTEPKKQPNVVEEGKKQKDIPSWAKNLMEANQKLLSEIEVIKTGKVIEDKKTIAKSVFESSEVLKTLNPKIKDSWMNRIDVNSETSIEDQVKSLETEFTNIHEEILKTTDFSGAVPFNTSGNLKPSENEIKGIVDNIIN